MSAVKGAPEHNFQIIETDECSGYRTHGDIFTYSEVWLNREIYHASRSDMWQYTVSVLESIFANSDLMHAMHHLKLRKSLGS